MKPQVYNEQLYDLLAQPDDHGGGNGDKGSRRGSTGGSTGGITGGRAYSGGHRGAGSEPTWSSSTKATSSAVRAQPKGGGLEVRR